MILVHQAEAQKLVVSAFEHWGHVMTYDESSSNSLQSPSVHNVGASHIVAGTDDPQPSMAPMVITSDWNAAYDPQPIPSYLGTISASDSIGMENLYSHISSEGRFHNVFESSESTFLESWFGDYNTWEAYHFDEPCAGQQTAENGSLWTGADQAVPVDNAQSRRGSKMGHALIYALIFSLRIQVVYSECVRKRQRLY